MPSLSQQEAGPKGAQASTIDLVLSPPEMLAMSGPQARSKTLSVGPRENALMKMIRARLAIEPDVFVFRNEVGNMQRLSDGGIIRVGAGIGSPDLLGCVGGRFCWWEVKRPKDRARTSTEQKAWHEMARKKGMIGAVVTSLDEAMAVVRDARQTNS